MIRKDRPELNEIELNSLVYQNYPKDDYELVVLDDSTTIDTPSVFKKFEDRINIQFYHFDNWKKSSTHYVGVTGRLNLTPHVNLGIRKAQGNIIILEAAESVHIGESLFYFEKIHESHPTTTYIPALWEVDKDAFELYNWVQHPENLWQNPRAWKTKKNPTNSDMITDAYGFLTISMRKAQWLRLGGMYESTMPGYDLWCGCEDEMLMRRILRSDCKVIMGDKYIMGPIWHPPNTSADYTTNNEEYKGKIRARIHKDAGYTGHHTYNKYYRPGTEKLPIKADTDWTHSGMPNNADMWNLDETIERLTNA